MADGTLFVLAEGVAFDAGITAPFAKLFFYQHGTATKQNTYTTKALSVAHDNPVIADANGKFPAIYLDPDLGEYKYVLALATDADPPVSPIDTQDNYLPVALSQSGLGALLFPQTQAEINASVTPPNIYRIAEPVYDLMRAGLVPNSTGARSANTAILKALLDPATAGPIGRFMFPPIIGSDAYYFSSSFIEIRDKCHLDLCGCTLDFAGSYSAANDTYGFLTFIRDVTIENGSITVDYDGTGGTNNGMLMRIGARNGYNFNGTFVDEEGLSRRMGNITLRNLRLASNNAAGNFTVLALGGLTNFLVENVTLNGLNVVPYGFWYEFGDYHYEATVANRKTSHAINMRLSNVYFFNHLDSGSGAACQIVGANPCVLENVFSDGSFVAVAFSPGEALYYNVGDPFLLAGSSKTRWHTLTNVCAQNCGTTSVSLVGSQAATGGYLEGEGLTDSQLCDLQGFIINNPNVDESIYCNGPFILNGGTIRHGGVSGGLIIGQDCLSFEVNGTHILDAGNEGIRANTADTCRGGGARNTRGVIRNAKIGGSNFGGGAAAAIGLDTCDGVRIENCQLGYSTVYDASNEATQTSGVSLAAGASNVVCENNYVKTNSGTAYVSSGSGDRGCDIRHARGERTSSGLWAIDGLAPVSAASIADKTNIINTASKYLYKKIYDTTNARIMVAQGATDVSAWKTAEGATTVTPA